MKLENQVCSLELAQKLKSLGVKQESVCWWARDWGSETGETFVTHDEARWDVIYAAFTVAELGEMLPMSVFYSDTGKEWLFCHRSIDRFTVGYGTIHDSGIAYMHLEDALTEADARAKCLIYLLENKLITL